MDLIPASTKVHRNRAHNVDSDRLNRRRVWLAENILVGFQGPRCEFAARAYELQAVENVLVSRGDLRVSQRRTLHGNAV